MSGTWDVRTVVHTFETGRVATLRASLPIRQLIRDGMLEQELFEALDKLGKGNLEDADKAVELQDAICRAMFVNPELSLDGQHREAKGGKPELVPIDAIDDEELTEVFELALRSVAQSARFRKDGGGAQPRRRSKSVGAKPKRAPRARARKS